MKKKELVITEPCEISIPKTGMMVHFDGEKCVIGFLHDTDLAVDGNLRIATKGNFEVATEGHQIYSTIDNDKKIMLGSAEKNYEKLKEIEDDGSVSSD